LIPNPQQTKRCKISHSKKMALWLQPEAINPICGMKQDVLRDSRCLFLCKFVSFYGVLKHLENTRSEPRSVSIQHMESMSSSPKTEHGVPERYPGNTSPATNDRHLCEQRTVIQCIPRNDATRGPCSLDHMTLFVGANSSTCRITASCPPPDTVGNTSPISRYTFLYIAVRYPASRI
jgi:hypothetical protein